VPWYIFSGDSDGAIFEGLPVGSLINSDFGTPPAHTLMAVDLLSPIDTPLIGVCQLEVLLYVIITSSVDIKLDINGRSPIELGSLIGTNLAPKKVPSSWPSRMHALLRFTVSKS